MNIVLFGIKGCGKTTFGKKVATALKKAFIDTDTLIEEFFQVNMGKNLSCREIFTLVGPNGFRALEYEVIQSLQDVQNSVIAVGGGAMTQMENVEALHKNSNLIYLIFDKELLKKRVLSAEEPPAFLDPNNPEISFDQVYDAYDEFFRKLKAKEINITKMKDEDVVDTICSFFSEEEKKRAK